jgi:hypothetical protein
MYDNIVFDLAFYKELLTKKQLLHIIKIFDSKYI